MLFNSFFFIFAFFPLTIIMYFILLRKQWVDVAHWFLIVMSFFMYGWVNPYYAVLLIGSILFNYLIAKAITTNYKDYSRKIVILGICVNVGGLIVLKYFNFLIENINPLFNVHLPLLHLGLALGISFITFMQIAYIVQVYQGLITDFNFKEYALFASFFPKLINGPIAYYNEIIPQFKSPAALKPNYANIAKGSYIFFIGLFKKLVIADTLALIANKGFDASTTLTMTEAWLTSVAYTFQIYFDFSGYIDMATGVALFFNILLPINFNSPYKAISIRDFWKRWHITLTRFLTTYIYIPLGGNRNGELNTLRNIMITFLISGFWHGAGWTFVFWGFLHGMAMVTQRLWEKTQKKLPGIVSVFITFNFVNIAWVFFRADTWADATRVLSGMFGFSGYTGLSFLATYGRFDMIVMGIAFLLAIVLVLAPANTNSYRNNFIPNRNKLFFQVALIIICLVFLNSSIPKEFIYNDF